MSLVQAGNAIVARATDALGAALADADSSLITSAKMSLKDRLKSKAHEWVRRKTITLPALREQVQVRGLVMGEVNRIKQAPADQQEFVQMALSMEDPETGAALYNANDLDDINALRAFPPLDVLEIINTGNILSGLAKEGEEMGKETSGTERSSTTSSVSASESPSPTSSTPSPPNSTESTS